MKYLQGRIGCAFVTNSSTRRAGINTHDTRARGAFRWFARLPLGLHLFCNELSLSSRLVTWPGRKWKQTAEISPLRPVRSRAVTSEDFFQSGAGVQRDGRRRRRDFGERRFSRIPFSVLSPQISCAKLGPRKKFSLESENSAREREGRKMLPLEKER